MNSMIREKGLRQSAAILQLSVNGIEKCIERPCDVEEVVNLKKAAAMGRPPYGYNDAFEHQK